MSALIGRRLGRLLLCSRFLSSAAGESAGAAHLASNALKEGVALIIELDAPTGQIEGKELTMADVCSRTSLP